MLQELEHAGISVSDISAKDALLLKQYDQEFTRRLDLQHALATALQVGLSTATQLTPSLRGAAASAVPRAGGVIAAAQPAPQPGAGVRPQQRAGESVTCNAEWLRT